MSYGGVSLQQSEQMGSWFSEGLNWIKDQVVGTSNGGSGTPPPGGTFPGTDIPNTGFGADTNYDLNTIATWATQQRQAGYVVTRVPLGYDTTGKVCARVDGPYTRDPNHPKPYTYVLAPKAVLDADARVQGAGRAVIEAIIPPAKDDPPPLGDLDKYLKYAAYGGGALLLLAALPYVLPRRAS